MAVKALVSPEGNHTAMRVRDLEGAVTFYTEVLGLEYQRAQGDDPNRPTAVFVTAIQLMRAVDQDVGVKGVLDHIGIRVRNLDELVASLRQNGVALENDRINDRVQDGVRIRTCFFRDPEGNRVELVERS